MALLGELGVFFCKSGGGVCSDCGSESGGSGGSGLWVESR